MNEIIEFYKNELGFKYFYDVILQNSLNNKDEFIQSYNLLDGYESNICLPYETINSSIGDFRVDVPIWFGNLSNAKKRIIIFGLEPRDTDSTFNIEKIGNKIFASPFGLDRWNNSSKVKRRPQNKYYRIFNDLISNKDNFVLFSDIVKDYSIISVNNEKHKNDKDARKQFRKKAQTQLSIIMKEIELVAPTHIITLGDDSYKFLSENYKCNIFRVRHPANGGERKAKKMLYDIIP
jgi:hypothetical protein